MDENVSSPIETEEITEATAAAIEAAWNESAEADGQEDAIAAEAAEPADPQDGAEEAEADENAQETGEKDPAEAKPKEDDQLFELKHLGETKKVTREEVTSLAQKGMDYDRIRAKYDELKLSADAAARSSQYADFVQELAKASGVSAEELIDQTRAKMLVNSEKAAGRSISEQDALARVKQQRESKAPDPAALKAEKQREAVRQFMELYPGMESDKIPAEVWAEAEKLGDLVGPYQKHVAAQQEGRIAELEREIEGLKLNQKNAARSTGSRKNAGAASAKSKVDAAWEEGLKEIM